MQKTELVCVWVKKRQKQREAISVTTQTFIICQKGCNILRFKMTISIKLRIQLESLAQINSELKCWYQLLKEYM